MTRRLKDILDQRVLFSVEKDQSVAEVARAMTDLNVGAILVLENGELRGIFSERDLMTRVVAEGLDPAEIAVQNVMTPDPVTVQDLATVQQALDIMRRNNCRHLPILHGRRVVGLVSIRDLVSHVPEERARDVRHVRACIESM